MAQGVHKITEDFEKSLCDYTGSPHAIALDNMSNALFLALYYEKNIKKTLTSESVEQELKNKILARKTFFITFPIFLVEQFGR